MQLPDIVVKDLVLIGGGHAHVHTIKMLGMRNMRGVAVTLITRDIESPYSGMIPGFVAGHYTREECHVDLAMLCSFSGVNLIHAEACGLDTQKRLVHCKDGRPPIHYDVLSIDVGIAPKPLPQVFSESKSNITPVKPIDGFAARWDIILARVLAGADGAPIKVAVVGGGAGGVELCFAMHYRLHKEMKAVGKDSSLLEISIYNRGKALMSSHSSQVQGIIKRIATERGINMVMNADIRTCNVTDGKEFLVAMDGRTFAFDEAVWCTEAVAQSWVKSSELETTEDGFICVTPNLESVNTPGVFACGDVAHLMDNPRPKAGVFAVRAGPPLTLNLRNKLLEKPLVPWVPQDQFLGIISTGNLYGIASKGPLGIEGEFLWELKDKIDRKWMRDYSALPDKEEMMKEMNRNSKLRTSKSTSSSASLLMSLKSCGKFNEKDLQTIKSLLEESNKIEDVDSTNNHSNTIVSRSEDNDENSEDEVGVSEVAKSMGQETIDMLSKAKMRCGGCGSKVGAQVLTRALSKVRKLLHNREEVIAGIGGKTGDDAALIRPPSPPHYLVQTLDYFRSFVSDPYLFGQIAANHALSDIYAMNGEPVSALALAILPYGPEDTVENTLVQILAGCLFVLKREECSLVGGHTSEGAELSMGLAVSGIVHPDKIFHKGLTGKKIDQKVGEFDIVQKKPIDDLQFSKIKEISKIIDTVNDPSSSEDSLGKRINDNPDDGSNGHLGHVLVLTKAIGTGTIMAAHMRAKAKGTWVKNAYDSMVQSNKQAAVILSTYGCSACTDITGFGLMGHLLEMIKFDDNNNDDDGVEECSLECRADDRNDRIAVEIYLNKVPTLHGAVECIKKGVFSSLQPQNIRCSRAVGDIHLGEENPVYPLLYDPQTSGGLLAAVPAHLAENLIHSLHVAGYPSAAVIGKVVKRKTQDILVILNK